MVGQGGGGNPGGEWLYFNSAPFFELHATCFMNAFLQGNGNKKKKKSFPRNSRVKNELTALMLVSLLTQTFNGGKRR